MRRYAEVKVYVPGTAPPRRLSWRRIVILLVAAIFAGVSGTAAALQSPIPNIVRLAGSGPGSFSGIVTNSVTGEPIEGAGVETNVSGSQFGRTGADGRYTITGLLDGSQFTLTAGARGFKDSRQGPFRAVPHVDKAVRRR